MDSSVLDDIEKTFAQTFARSDTDSNLTLKRAVGFADISGDPDAVRLLWSTDVSSVDELKDFAVSYPPWDQFSC